MTRTGQPRGHSATEVGARRAVLDIAVQVAGRFFNLLPGIVVTVVLTRALGDARFGQWSTIFAVSALMGYVGQFGLDQVAVKRGAAAPEEAPAWLGALVSLRAVIAVPMAVAVSLTIALLASDDQMRIAGLIVGTLALGLPIRAMRGAFQLRIRNDLDVAVLTANTILWTGGVIVTAAAGGGLVAFTLVFAAANWVTTVLEGWLATRMIHPTFAGARKRWRELLRAGIPLGIVTVLTFAYGNIDQVLVFQLAGPGEAGQYGAVYRILSQAQFVPIALMTTLFPILSAAQRHHPARVPRLVQVAADYLALVSLPALAFSVVAAEPVVRLLFGHQYLRAAPALPILMAAFVLICFGYVVGNLSVILDLQRRFVRYAVAALVFNVALNLVLIPPYGFLAAAWVTLATEVLVLSLGLRLTLRTLHTRPVLGRIGQAALCAAGMAAAVGAARLAGAPVGVLLAVGAVVYPALLIGLRVVSPAELRELLRERDRAAAT